MSEWQPIETAPKDGKAILLYYPKLNLPVIGSYYVTESIVNGKTKYRYEGWSAGLWWDHKNEHTPIKWLPLPDLPDGE